MNTYKFLSIIVAAGLILCSCAKTDDTSATAEQSLATDGQESVKVLDIEEADGIRYYLPTDSAKVDLYCGEAPSLDNDSVIFVRAAAYTGRTLGRFDHSNIAGNHVSHGKLHHGYKCKDNTGVFMWSEESGPRFFSKFVHPVFGRAAREGGMAFAQEMLIEEGKPAKHTRKDWQVNQFYALGMKDGKLFVAECIAKLTLGDFINRLVAHGTTNAIYLDGGSGWDYGWYRTELPGNLTYLHSKEPYKYQTNWLVFYK